MAAGRGSRFGGMKQVAGLGPSGESLFDYAVYDAVQAGLADAVFVVSEESREAVAKHISAGLGKHVEVRYALQEAGARPKPWGTGQAVLVACAEVRGSFGVINADDFYRRRSFELLAEALESGEDHVNVAFRLQDTLSSHGGVSRGLCLVDDNGLLTGIQELHDVRQENGKILNDEGVELTGDESVSMNLWGFRSSFCDVLSREFDRFRQRVGEDDQKSEFLIGDAVDALPRHGAARVRVVRTPEHFLGVTYQEDVEGVRAELARLVDEGVYPSPVWG
jgi:NDP-sugar pyrophosphorylase family protein